MERGPHYWGRASAASSFFWLLKICRARFWLSANGTLTNLLDGLPIGSIFHAATDISEQNYGPDSSIIWPIRDCARWFGLMVVAVAIPVIFALLNLVDAFRKARPFEKGKFWDSDCSV
jgi:hypothetical protein